MSAGSVAAASRPLVYKPPIRAVLNNGVYIMPWLEGRPINKSGFDVLKWKCSASPPKFPTPAEASVLVPSVAVDKALLARPVPRGELRSTWCGHASFLVQMDNGCNVLTDPVWSQRASPVQFAGPARYVDAPIKLEDLPVPVDIVTISHNHYDHLDTATVIKLYQLFDPLFIVPAGMKAWFEGLSASEGNPNRVVELSWYESVDVGLGTDVSQRTKATADFSSISSRVLWSSASAVRDFPGEATVETLREGLIRITGVPVQHWSLRSGFDRNKQLWCGFVLETHSSGGPSPSSAGSAVGAKATAEEFSPIGEAPSSSTAAATTGDSAAARGSVVRWTHLGDTGYHAEPFTNIGAQFPTGFDLALIAIGAYEPRWFMCEQHVDPKDALQIHFDIGSRFSLGMHWGTFILTDEPVDEPPKELRKALDQAGVDPGVFLALKHGETVSIPPRGGGAATRSAP